MGTCGRCGQRDQTAAQIRACYAAAGVPTAPSSGTADFTHTGSVTPGRTTLTAPGTPKAKPRKKATKKVTGTRVTKRAERGKKGSTSRRSGTEMPRGPVGVESQPPPGQMTAAEFRERYPSGATKTPSATSSGRKPKPRTGNRNRGGANFRDGLVNPPPTGGIASSDY